MFAVIKTGGKQFRVSVGDTIYVEKLPVENGGVVTFDALMVGENDNIRVGTPVVEGAAVEGRVVRQVKGQKIVIFKYKPKKNIRKKQGHRQPYTQVEITTIR
jgi:large subunit ribosomal protein L21